MFKWGTNTPSTTDKPTTNHETHPTTDSDNTSN